MFEAGVVAGFRAAHVMPHVEGPEGQLHSHDYRVEIAAERHDLDEQGMVVDIDLLNESLEETLSRIRDRNLDEVIDSAEQAGVTVELLARWIHDRLRERIPAGEVVLTVRVWESADAFGGYRTPNSSS